MSTPTTDDLLDAYKRTGLKRCKVSFLQALESPMFSRCLTRMAESALHQQEAQGNPAPNQRAILRGRYAD